MDKCCDAVLLQNITASVLICLIGPPGLKSLYSLPQLHFKLMPVMMRLYKSGSHC